LRHGDRIALKRHDGRTITFSVTKTDIWPRDRFPSEQIYGPTPGPQLTLLTCADWDEEKQTYRSNLVLTAQPADT
ncbi:MAG TPA: class F sortase, partial [Streptomyces sp.]|nr:class F sortase [Streptomyces sp.]